MCGIFGGYDYGGNTLDRELAEAACRRLLHRGPDAQGYLHQDNVLLGNARLSILDIESGQQPMVSDDGQIAVVQNGEIYNFVELARGLDCRTRCDTEVILRLYEREGPQFVERLNGMFAIAIHDRRTRSLLLFRDRVGKKPLYIYDDGQRLLFASEIKALLAMGVERRLDWGALDGYLTYNFVPPPATLYAGIRHLPPGHLLIANREGVQQAAWWRLEAVQPVEQSPQEWQDQIVETLRDAVRVRRRSDVPLGAFLSGGIDSSLITALLAELSSERPRTFSIGFTDPRFDESAYAEQAARYCNTVHINEVVTSDLVQSWPLTVYHNDQPHGDVSFMPTYWVSRLARQHVKVVLTGDGGDELFAGYDVHRQFFQTHDLNGPREDLERAYVEAISLFSQAEKERLYSSEATRAVGTQRAFAYAEPILKSLRHQDPINQMLGLDVQLLLPGNNLVKPDRMAMAVSLEPRAPFLDYRMVELAFRMPGYLKLEGGQTKAILKSACQGLLPRQLIYRKKQMFTVPIGEWFKRSLAPLLRQVLLSKRTIERELFCPRVVAAMIEAHIAGRANFTRQLRALVALELWHRIFVDQTFESPPSYEEIGIEYVASPEGRSQAA